MTSILLIAPPATPRLRQRFFATPPLGLGYLAAMLLDHGFIVAAKDFWFETMAAVRQEILALQPDIIGIQVLSHQALAARDCARVAKQLIPSVKVVFGGSHATALPKLILEHWPEVDFVVIGEGETAFLNLASALEAGRSVASLLGIGSRGETGEIVVNGHAAMIAELSSLPWPARRFFPLDDYPQTEQFGLTLPRLGIVSSRGCHGRCSFCASSCLWQGRWRTRTATDIADELEALVDRYPGEPIRFFEDNFGFNPDRVLALCREIVNRGLHFDWWANSRIDLPEHKLEEMFAAMREAGCVRLSLGIESAAREVLAPLGKRIEPEQIERVFAAARRQKLAAHCFLMLGNIGETAQTIEATMRLIRRTQPWSVNTTVATIYPGTALAEWSATHPGSLQNQERYDDSFWLTHEEPPNFVGFIKEYELPLYSEKMAGLEWEARARQAPDPPPAALSLKRLRRELEQYGSGLALLLGALALAAFIIMRPLLAASFPLLSGIAAALLAQRHARRNFSHVSAARSFIRAQTKRTLRQWFYFIRNRMTAALLRLFRMARS